MGGAPHEVAVTPSVSSVQVLLWPVWGHAGRTSATMEWVWISVEEWGGGREERGQAVTVTKQQRQGGHRHLKKPRAVVGIRLF